MTTAIDEQSMLLNKLESLTTDGSGSIQVSKLIDLAATQQVPAEEEAAKEVVKVHTL